VVGTERKKETTVATGFGFKPRIVAFLCHW